MSELVAHKTHIAHIGFTHSLIPSARHYSSYIYRQKKNSLLLQTNSFQAILTTDGNSSYAIFTYECGSMGWSRDSTIGFNAAGSIFANHPLSGRNARSVACSNAPASNWTNLIYNLTGDTVDIPQPPTVEPRKKQVTILLQLYIVCTYACMYNMY